MKRLGVALNQRNYRTQPHSQDARLNIVCVNALCGPKRALVPNYEESDFLEATHDSIC